MTAPYCSQAALDFYWEIHVIEYRDAEQADELDTRNLEGLALQSVSAKFGPEQADLVQRWIDRGKDA